MIDENNTPVEPQTNDLVPVDLQAEALTIVNQIAAETNTEKLKDLTYLFNINQDKKTILTMSKQSELLDLLTDTTLGRVKANPNNFSTDDLVKLMKTISDLLAREREQINHADDAPPLIQINQQNNKVNMGEDPDSLGKYNHESRDKIKNAVLKFLKNAQAGNLDDDSVDKVIDATAEVINNDK